ncbi:MAG: 4Fe-4S dicluster domain-containing protein [Candidatus Thorarchaeota archaeon]|nr:MAG: 4Fe-4S dicluster domain-containing protein [Candidatus Thorarchaeota archaeon]
MRGPQSHKERSDVRRFLVIDLDRCTGCRNCELACSVRNTSTFNPRRARIQVLRDEERNLIVPVVCLQCEHPMCREVCPVGAIVEGPAGVLTVTESCIGCGICVTACMYGGIVLDPATRRAVKCDLCGGDPVCVKTCEYGAITLVDADKSGLLARSEASQRAMRTVGIIVEDSQ